jgi:CxxC motif-containing protein (DUF1111 family)
MNACTTALSLGVALALPLALIAMAQGPSPDNSAANAGVRDRAYRQPLANLTPAELEQFEAGSKGFAQRWVVAPSILGLWGRGPTSNGEACTDCHDNGGRGRASDSTDATPSMLVRLSIPGTGPRGAPRADPRYGDQLQEEGILGRVPAEGRALIVWSQFDVTLNDGEVVRLRRPRLEIRDLAFGPLADNIMTSVRVAPALVGVGLIDAISEDAIHAQELRQRELNLSGHANRVWDFVQQREAIGRFGRKANQPHLLQQVVSAYHADLGVTSQWFPEENCPAVQTQCRAEPPGGHPELPAAFLDPVLFYLRTLAPPRPRATQDASVQRGEELFHAAGCANCHLPQWRTARDAVPAALADRVIHPYTDLLVHDLGDGLADGRPDYHAGSREWRTAPLWGLGRSETVNGNSDLLHDGRARSATEAILWHGGEAERSREAFRRMPRADRNALIEFLGSL